MAEKDYWEQKQRVNQNSNSNYSFSSRNYQFPHIETISQGSIFYYSPYSPSRRRKTLSAKRTLRPHHLHHHPYHYHQHSFDNLGRNSGEEEAEGGSTPGIPFSPEKPTPQSRRHRHPQFREPPHQSLEK